MYTRFVFLSKDEQISMMLPLPEFLCDLFLIRLNNESKMEFCLKKITTKINPYKVCVKKRNKIQGKEKENERL